MQQGGNTRHVRDFFCDESGCIHCRATKVAWLWPTFPYLCALRCAMGTLWTTEVVILTGRSIVPAGASNEDTPEVMAMKAELVALRAFKATTAPAATTGAGKRACAQQDRLPKLRASGELHAPSATSNSGEKGSRCGNCQYQQATPLTSASNASDICKQRL